MDIKTPVSFQEVESVGVNEFLNGLLSNNVYTKVILKMDIEGSEFELLENINFKNLTLIDHTYIELHDKMFRQPYRKAYRYKRKK